MVEYKVRKELAHLATVVSPRGAIHLVDPVRKNFTLCNGDCDFFVGITNFTITTWEDAVKATLEFFGRSQ